MSIDYKYLRMASGAMLKISDEIHVIRVPEAAFFASVESLKPAGTAPIACSTSVTLV